MKKNYFLFVLAVMLMVFSGCDAKDTLSGKYLDIKEVDYKTHLAFSEVNPDLTTRKNLASLYYRYGKQNILVAEEREIEVRSGEIAEYAILKELLKGPRSSSGMLSALISSDVEVLNAVPLQENRILAITFSESFLGGNAQFDEQGERLRRELLLQSICLSITDNTPYLGIQIFIRPNDVSKSIYRLDNSFLLQSNTLPLLPIVREDSFLSNPQNNARLFLSAWSKNDVETMQLFLHNAPGLSELKEMVEAANNIVSFDLGSGSLQANSSRSTIAATIEPINTEEYLVFPLQMVLDYGLWKIDYQNFLMLLRFV